MSALSARIARPWRRPRVGIAFSPHSLLVVRAGNGGGGPVRKVRRDLPPGLLVPSAVIPNIQSVREVARLASEMVDELGGRGSTAVLLLPDLAVVSAVFPASPGEGGGDHGSKLASRLGFPASEARSDFWRGGKGEVLGAAVRESVVRQYEQVVEAAECRPGWIDAATLARIPSWTDRSLSDPGVILVEALLYSSHYSLALFRGGELLDVRTRLRASGDVDEVAKELMRLPAMYGIGPLDAVSLSGDGAFECARALSESRIEARLSHEDGGEAKQLEAALAALLARN